MSLTISATEANQRFSELLRRVSAGESFTILSRGRPVAEVRPVEPDLQAQGARVRAMLDELKKRPRSSAYGWTRESLYE